MKSDTEKQSDTAAAPLAGRASVIAPREADWLLSAPIYVADRPGELAAICEAAAEAGANIELFDFNRSRDAHRVRMEMSLADARQAGSLLDKLAGLDRLYPPREASHPLESAGAAHLTDPEGLFRVSVTLDDKPGRLAALARLFRDFQANVIHMNYDGVKRPGLIEVTTATESATQVGELMDAMGRAGYVFHVAWLGADGPEGEVIGLKEVEAFLFKLKRLLPKRLHQELSELISSSRELRETLIAFREAAGRDRESMAASEVYGRIIELAAASLGKTGENFRLRLTGPVAVSPEVELYVLACPTGANAHLLIHGDDITLIDSSYGLYYPDVAAWLSQHSFEPERISRAAFTHADADHAGWAAPLGSAGSRVFMHPDARDVLRLENRVLDRGGLTELNRLYTKLINRFTELHEPEKIESYPPPPKGAPAKLGGFPVTGSFTVGDLRFLVLESLGGHVPAQIFLLEPDKGLLFSGDYLIDVQSLSERTKSTLSLAKHLITSTNADSALFSREMKLLASLMADVEAGLHGKGKAMVFPGHGDFYAVRDTDWGRAGPREHRD